jgi:hypothetical protein
VIVVAALVAAGCRTGGGRVFDADAREAAPPRPPRTEAARRDAIARSQVWDQAQHDAASALTPEQVRDGPQGEHTFAFDQAVTCRFVEPTLDNVVGGNTPKFLCGGGTTESPCPECTVTQKELKVKYGEGAGDNPEIYAEVIGTRLMWLLGFKADSNYPVRVTCLNCPSDPWGVYRTFRERTDGLDKDAPEHVERANAIARSLGGSRATRAYRHAIIEIKLAASKIKVDGIDCRESREASDPRCGGFSWNEAAQVNEAAGGAPPAHVDALKLLAAFMTHGDNKPGNQRLVCPDGKKADDGTCTAPFVMIQDIGAGFGSTRFFNLSYRKADINAWSGQPLWSDLSACRAKLASNHQLKDPVVSEAGRAFLSRLADPSVLTDEKLRAIFLASRVIEKGDRFEGRAATVADWVNVFNRKRADLARPCGGSR